MGLIIRSETNMGLITWLETNFVVIGSNDKF